jgi:hypothetical protein
MRHSDSMPPTLLNLAPVDHAHLFIVHKTAGVSPEEVELRERFASAFNADDWATATDVVAQAQRELGPRNALWMIWDGLIDIARERLDSAHQTLLLALPFAANAQQRAVIFVNLSLVELKRENYQKTGAWSRLAVESDPLNQAAWVNLLVALINLGDMDRLSYAVDRITTIFDLSQADQLRYHLTSDPDLTQVRSMPAIKRLFDRF